MAQGKQLTFQPYYYHTFLSRWGWLWLRIL